MEKVIGTSVENLKNDISKLDNPIAFVPFKNKINNKT